MNNKHINKIGVLESWAYPFDKSYQKYFKNGIEINDLNEQTDPRYKTHSTMVSMIAGGAFGFDRTSQIYLYNFGKHESKWATTIEKMVKTDGIRIINHSYGPSMYDEDGNRFQSYDLGYDEDAYFLDYITRKYGVINILAASNNGENNTHYITNQNLSFNTIIIGALDDSATKYNIKKNIIASYSNYRHFKEFENISKPLVVAPAQFYNPVYNINSYYNGTSYAAPVVTGLISNLLKYRSDIINSDYKIPIVKAILSASAVSPKHDNLNYKSSGYEQKFGAGTVDFSAMLKAADNISTIKIHPSQNNGFIFSSNEIILNKNQTIKVSSSWLFNAGILSKSEPNTPRINGWHTSYHYYPWLIYKDAEWKRNYNDPEWLKQSEAQKRQGGKWFTDYDLYLERKDKNGNWVTVLNRMSEVSNDEIIEYKATEPGTYRYRIKKFNKINFTNSVEDLIAVTHVVRNED